MVEKMRKYMETLRTENEHRAVEAPPQTWNRVPWLHLAALLQGPHTHMAEATAGTAPRWISAALSYAWASL